MIPSTKPEVCAIINTIPQLEVVLFGVERNVAPQEFNDRFKSQTRRTKTIDELMLPVFRARDDTWKSNPEFEVLHEDEPILRGIAAVIAGEERFVRNWRMLQEVWLVRR